MHDFSARSLRQLGRALEAAIRDKVAEMVFPHIKTCIYCDADIVIGAVYPFHSMAVTAPGSTSPISNVVRSMWTAGHLAPVGMLWPHLAEFHRAIQKERDQPSQKYLLDYAARTRIPALRDALRTRPDQVLASAQECLGVEEYVVLWASQYATLSDRLAAIGDNLDLTMDAGDSLRGVVDATMTQSLAQRILAVRSQSSSFLKVFKSLAFWGESRRTRNALSDAISLLTIARFALGQNQSRRRVRFITSAEALFDAADLQSWVRAARDPDPAGDDGLLRSSVRDDPDGPMRSMEYMYLRGVVPSLSFQTNPGSEPMKAEYSSWDIDDLRETVSGIKVILHPEWHPDFSDLNVVGRKLYDDIHRGSAGLFFRKVWMNGMSDDSVIKALNRLDVAASQMVPELTSEMNRNRIDQINHNQFHELVLNMSARVSQLETHWFAQLEHQRATEAAADQNVILQGGISRWLAGYSGDSLMDWEDTIRAVESESESDPPAEIPKSATQARSVLAKLLVLDMLQTKTGADVVLSLADQIASSSHDMAFKFAAMCVVNRARLTKAAYRDQYSAPPNALAEFEAVETWCRQISDKIDAVQDVYARARMHVACAWMMFQVAIERQHHQGQFLGQLDSVSKEGVLYIHARRLLGVAAMDLDEESRKYSLVRAIDLITAVPVQGGSPLFPPGVADDEIDITNPYNFDAIIWWRVARQNRLAKGVDHEYIESLRPLLSQFETTLAGLLSHERFWRYHLDWYSLAKMGDAGETDDS